MSIKKIHAHEILDSRGNPTVECLVTLDNEISAKASVPSGASTGKHEALELRDNDKKRFAGKGVLQACQNINKKIAKKLIGHDINNQQAIDNLLIKLAGDNKKKLGANATLAVSLACARAAAIASNTELYEYINKSYQLPTVNRNLPTPMFNVFNGGAHADNELDIQEFMLVPTGIKNYNEQLRAGTEIFHTLGKILKQKNLDTDVGNEGGYAPDVASALDVFDLLISAIKQAGYLPNAQIKISLDVGASEFYNSKTNKYELKLEKMNLNSEEMILLYKNLIKKYPILSIEDGLAQDAWRAWQRMADELLETKNHDFMLVGDDLTTTNAWRLYKTLEHECANAVIVKPNQIGTLSETIKFVQLAQENSYQIIVSHRSGETCDDFIADLAVAVNADFAKFGAPSRGERVTKYNRLLEISRNPAP